MEGKRFGVGLAAGLLVALAIVGASGGLNAPSSPSYGPVAASTTFLSTATSTLTASSTSSPGTGALMANVTSTQSATSALSNLSTAVSGTTSSSSTATGSSSTAASTFSSASTSSITPQYGSTSNQTAGAAANQTNNPGYSSRIYSIAHQPALSNAVIFIPVLVAFLLGAFLYRVAISNRKSDE